YGKKIWALNQDIIAIETGGIERANDLRDTRDKLLDELACLGKIAYDEDIHGVVTIQFEGVDFVTKDYVNEMGYIRGYEYNKLFAEDIAKGLRGEVDDSFYVPSWPMLKNQEVFSVSEDINSDKNTDIGSLKALYNARGNRRATYRDLYPVGETYPEYPNVNNAVVIEGKEYEAVKDPITGHYNNIVADGGHTYTVSDDGVVTSVDTGKVYGTLGINSRDSKIFYEAKTQRSAIMNVMAEFDNLIHGIVTGMNKILSSDGTPEGTDEDVLLFKRIAVPSAGIDVSHTDGWVTDNLMINPLAQQVPALVNKGFLMSDKSVDQYKADALVDLFGNTFSRLSPDTNTQLTFAGYYIALTSENATNGRVYYSVSTNQEAMRTSLDNQRQEVVGVSDSDELTHMIRYQNAYNASSRYINTINSMLDTLINAMT
ncbi:MAG TPA: hypothetical protein DIS68_05875, partial [Lachnospiraceae bacterium]|nr:hypothetical protein [Lachnospiraceae bacterium]